MASKNKKLSSAVELFEQDIGGTIRKINLKDIQPASDQPRQTKDINIENLANSLKQEGLLQPIVVTKKEGKFLIIAGERRYRAATMLGWRDIECRILHKEDKDRFRLAVIENLQRENLSPFEEAYSYKRLKEEFAYKDSELADILGKSRNYINEILSIDEIPLDLKKQAEQLNINSTNLLIQLASAHRNNFAEEFIKSFRQGQINNVKEAKSFVQQKKETGKNTPKNPPTKHPFDFSVNFQQKDQYCSIEIRIDSNLSTEQLKKITQEIKKTLNRV